ncbi:conserved hypothetical protein [Cupriavidus metallidurans CH34]|uniref:Uncharacterized protein n=1 Tax=Cupriavidus metallidurans (strain ATCC 43123 / DSM 2839 / NBRC 102507 / CH34) TaxID=266264 RepID=D3DXK5_CUPMC|nr:conserved hypothetical protein [Cupriavidus metallidurans CH34]
MEETASLALYAPQALKTIETF